MDAIAGVAGVVGVAGGEKVGVATSVVVDGGDVEMVSHLVCVAECENCYVRHWNGWLECCDLSWCAVAASPLYSSRDSHVERHSHRTMP